MNILNVKAREILDSRGNPTIEVEIKTRNGIFKAIAPSGASTGIYEAIELRDNDKNRYNGKGVLRAVKKVNTIIKKHLIGLDVENQEEIDNLMIKLDSTKNKSKLGGNSIIAVSMAVCRAGANSKKMELYEHIADLAGNKKLILPIPSFNIINGGVHAGNNLAIQEFMIYPKEAKNFKQALRMGSEIYHVLKNIIKKKYGLNSINVGDEGGFAPNIKDSFEAIELLNLAIKKAGYEKKIKINLDCAASEFYRDNKYDINFKSKKSLLLSGESLLKRYEKICEKFDIFSIEDPFDQNDFDNFNIMMKRLGNKIQIMGDDLLVTNVNRIKLAINKNAVNSLLLKVNQIGTITESIKAFKLAKKAGWKIMVSHRSGESSDSFIADLAVGLGCGQIKSGAPCRSERLAKYNRLLRIEEKLGNKSRYGC